MTHIIPYTKFGRTLLLLTAVLAVGLSGCGGDDDDSSKDSSNNQPAVVNTQLNGTWLRGNSDRYYQIKIDGTNWVYSEGPAGNVSGYSKGTWSSNSTITAPSSGTVTLTITQVSPNQDGSWIDLPPSYNSVKVNTATYDLDASGSLFTIRDAALTTNGVWGTLEGTYQKQSLIFSATSCISCNGNN